MIERWLQRRVTVAEAEAAHMVRAPALGPDPVPFGFSNREWRELLAEIQDGDELLDFSSPPETWEQLMGWEGYALVRQGKVVEIIGTAMN